MLLTNKHIVVALIVAPILAVLSWFLVDSVVSEKALPAVAGASYPLVAKSNCRYSSGRCTFVNEEFAATVNFKEDHIALSSTLALDTVQIAIVDAASDATGDQQPKRVALQQSSDNIWRYPLVQMPDESMMLRLVVDFNGSKYFGETTLAFIEYDAGFDAGFASIDTDGSTAEKND